MTITYTLDVSSSKFLSFTKLLLRWRGSVWKVVWQELLLWLIMYAFLSLIYRLALTASQREVFEDVVSFCYKYADQIPLTFMLGFYVSLVVNRWWDMLCNIGWVDVAALHLAAYIPGSDDRARMLRRNCVRYMVLTQSLVFRNISPAVRKRFPTDDTLVTAGLMTEPEKVAFDSVDSPHKKNYLPTHWIFTLLRQARQEGRITSDLYIRDLYDKINTFRGCVGKLSQYDWVPIPLVYTQVVFLTVRCYFLIALMGRQFLLPTPDRAGELSFSSPVDLYIPILSMIQFVFYVGWMKVAEALLNPFGDDDDDFEVNYMIDRNLQVGFTIVDDAIGKTPAQVKDKFWGEAHPEPLYTEETANRPVNPLVGSAANIDVPVAREGGEVRMVRKQSTFSALNVDENSRGHRQSEVGALSRTSSGRSSRRFSEMLKKRFGRRASKTPATQPSSPSPIPENGDLPPTRTFNIPSATKAHYYSDGMGAPSSATTNLNEVLSAMHEDDQSDEVFSPDALEVVHEVEEVDDSNPLSSTRHSSGENKN